MKLFLKNEENETQKIEIEIERVNTRILCVSVLFSENVCFQDYSMYRL